MRLFAYIIAGTVAGLTGGYLAWCRTTEGRICGHMVREELNHYSPVREAERIARGG